jgi:hypothetical protein
MRKISILFQGINAVANLMFAAAALIKALALIVHLIS